MSLELCVKVESEWEANSGVVSEAETLEGLEDHIKSEYRLSPEILQSDVTALPGQDCVKIEKKEQISSELIIKEESDEENSYESTVEVLEHKMPPFIEKTEDELCLAEQNDTIETTDINSYATVDDRTDKCFKCNYCNYASHNKSNISVHERIHTGEQLYKCSHCSFVTGKKSQLTVHKRKHAVKQRTCSHCGDTSADKRALKDHMKIMHPGEKFYKCKYCSYTDSKRNDLIKHERIHTGDKPHKCSQCGYATAKRGNLIAHEKIHSDEKPFKCQHCCYASCKKSALTVHLRTHTGVNAHKCRHCTLAPIGLL